MVIQKVRQSGNSMVITLPREEAERKGIKVGDLVTLEVQKARISPEMRPELQAHLEAAFSDRAADLEYLAER